MIIKNANSQNFIKKLNGRKVICFGAGSLLNDISNNNISQIENLKEYIAFFVDNNKKKIGLKYSYKNKDFDIYDVNILNDIDTSKYVILVTCVAHIEIYNQLQKIENLENIECYFYRLIVFFPNSDMNYFLKNELNKPAYSNWKQRLENLNLKDKYKGKRCFIIGNGPSLKIEDLELLKNEITFGANRIYLAFDKTDWRPTYYTCVDSWAYEKDYNIIKNMDCEFKFTSLGNAEIISIVSDEFNYFKYITDKTELNNDKIIEKNILPFSYDITNCVYSASTILYVQVQFAAYMGFSEIYLIGVDCNYRHEIHNNTKVENCNISNHFTDDYDKGFEHLLSKGAPVDKMQIAWQSAKEGCEKVGITIKNATRGGKLEIFERVNFDELMKYNK